MHRRSEEQPPRHRVPLSDVRHDAELKVVLQRHHGTARHRDRHRLGCRRIKRCTLTAGSLNLGPHLGRHSDVSGVAACHLPDTVTTPPTSVFSAPEMVTVPSYPRVGSLIFGISSIVRGKPSVAAAMISVRAA